MELSKEQEELSMAYKEAGWSFDWEYPIDNDQRNCFWHGGQYAYASGQYRGHEWEIYYNTCGDVIGTLFDEDRNELATVYDKWNNCDRDDIMEYVDDDKELEQAWKDGRLELENNNWNEMLILMDGQVQYTNDNDIGADDVVSDVLPPDALFEYLDGFLDEEEEA